MSQLVRLEGTQHIVQWGRHVGRIYSVFDRFIELPELVIWWPSADDDMEDAEDALDVAGWPSCGQRVMAKRNRKAEKLPLPSNAIILTIYIESSFKMT